MQAIDLQSAKKEVKLSEVSLLVEEVNKTEYAYF
jgi:hypothetical protein